MKQKLLAEEKHDFESLCQLTEILRSEEGCPWDREQTHESIRTDLIEETYEAVEAIDKADAALLREELGDVLFQVIFHSRIEEEAGRFSVNDVIGDIVDKMILRHPHVFGEVKADTSAEVLENWDKIKEKEKKRDTLKTVLEAVPKQYPALLRARKVQKKARKGGLTVDGSAARLTELAEAAGAAETADERNALLTELIWQAVSLGGADADLEMLLGAYTDRFIDAVPDEE